MPLRRALTRALEPGLGAPSSDPSAPEWHPSVPTSDQVPAPSVRGRKLGRRTLIFPGLVMVLVLTLGLLRLSGSSLGVYERSLGGSDRHAGILAGPARTIRSDEWLVRTPWLFRQVELGLPARVRGGVGSHDVAVLADLPTRGWEVVLRPHTLVYQLLDEQRAFALEWWTLQAVQLLGVYVLLLALTRRPAISAFAALLLTLSPATQWWAAPGTFTTVGYGSLGAGLFLFGCRAETRRARIGFALAAGLAFGAFLAAFYIPWQVGTLLVVAPVTAGAMLPDLLPAATRWKAIRSLATVAIVSMGIGCGLFAAFLIRHREAVRTVAATAYPGKQPANEAGNASLPIFWGSPFDYFSSQRPYAEVNGTNQSENSSAIVLLLPVGLMCFAIGSAGGFRARSSVYPLLGCLLGGTAIAAWMLLPVPAWMGRVVFLTRAPPGRLFLPLGFAGVVALALFAHHRIELDRAIPSWMPLASAAALAAVEAWDAGRYLVSDQRINLRVALGFITIVCAGVALALGRRPVVGLAVLAAFCLWQASLINPIQRGAAPLIASPLRRAIDRLEPTAPRRGGWIGFGTDALVNGTLTASGVNNLSGVSPYPDRAAWRILDPDLSHRDAWNRYAHLGWTVGPPGSAAAFDLRSTDSLTVTIDPCSPALTKLGVEFFVAQGVELDRCARAAARVRHGEGFVTLYRRVAPA